MSELLRATRGPFVGGYTSAIPPFMAGENQLVGPEDGSDTNASLNCVIDPVSGSVSKRTGCIIVGDIVSSGAERDGILNAALGVNARRMFALDSTSMDDSYPVPAVLYGADTGANPGTLYVRSTNGSDDNYSLLQEFGSTHYPTGVSGTGAAHHLKVVPVWMDSGDGVYNRGALTGTAGTDKFMQQYLTCGSRSVLQTQGWCYFPNLKATPFRWNKRLNESSSSGSEIVRIYPTGPFSPLYPPRYDSTRLPSAANGSSWVEGDTYYVSCVFQFEDGSYSLPFVPRAINPVLTSGLGLVTVGSISATPTNKYPYVTYRVPLGPEGTVARILLRTPKQNRTAVTDTITVSPLDLRVLGVLRNNTQTLYLDYGGDDDSLVEDDNVVRFDLVCPRRARYIGTGDQRAVVGYTLPNTAAIMLALVNVNLGGANDYDQNVSDVETIGTTPYNSKFAAVRITATDLELHYNLGDGATAPIYDTAPTYSGTANGNAVKFPFATYTTLEAMVDAINFTGTGSNCKQWAAQLAPGIDGTMPSSSLTKTTFDITSCVLNGTTSVTKANPATGDTAFSSVGVGMRVSKSTDITDGTYVVSKSSTGAGGTDTLILSNVALTSDTETLTFYQETGDNAVVSGGTVGYIRAWGPALPVLLHCKASAFPNYDKADKQSVYYTQASPGAVQSGSSLAPNSFLSGNKLVGHSSPRQQMQRTVMGIVDVEGAAVVAYSDGINLFRNVRGGNTGEDFDCRLFTVNDGRGCISYRSLVSGNGWACYATTEGLVATDKTGKEVVISGDVFNASDLTGSLAYEIKTSAASAASDSDDQYLTCAVLGSKLYVAVRQSGLDTRILTYDFSKGVEANGLEELLDPEKRSTYIWNPPLLYNGNYMIDYGIGAIGCIRNASGRMDYICTDSNRGTYDGRIDRINLTADDGAAYAQDNVAYVQALAIVAPFVASEFMALSAQRIEATHKTTTGTASLRFALNQTPTFNATSPYPRTLKADTLRTRFNKQVIPVDQKQRGKTDIFWAQWYCADETISTSKLWRLVLEYSEAENDVAMRALS